MTEPSLVNGRWRFKRNRGFGTFTVMAVNGDRITLQAAWNGKRKTISLRTLRSDYEPVGASG